ncbi:hypothetical protein [Globicatella sanguinis]
MANLILELSVFHEIYRGNDSVQAFQERIADSLTALNQGGE